MAKIAVEIAMRVERAGRASGIACVGAVGGSGVESESLTAGRYSTRPPRGHPRHDFMANIHSQKKRILRAERERLENRRYTSSIKTYFRRLEAAVAAGEDETAETEHRVLVSTIDKAVKRGALHRNNGARKKSRAARLRRGA
jgi:small subunit ribosomal protein S20